MEFYFCSSWGDWREDFLLQDTSCRLRSKPGSVPFSTEVPLDMNMDIGNRDGCVWFCSHHRVILLT